ncbi:cell wall hydrolase [Chitinibacter bivalviorum]|uniref:Cell wall hydrolase n=1 Tax=Chitinibacter bivalviorum TaxID=2739434 RepID=A0A7H9BLY2_9NEIS|nr:cell wall hydrolase [Chitinibacter bivalviorum]QLG89071.1 cell wall hydrolase [Chitinibacter bivalviorum]
MSKFIPLLAIACSCLLASFASSSTKHATDTLLSASEVLKVIQAQAEPPPQATATQEVVPPFSAKDRETLILNAFNEARGEGKKGIKAVLGVTMSRVESACYPDTVTEVVYQRKQFSWTSQRGTARTLASAARIDSSTLRKIQTIVDDYIAEGAKPNRSLLYHANYVKPSWAKSRQVKKVKTIGKHHFYDLKNC